MVVSGKDIQQGMEHGYASRYDSLETIHDKVDHLGARKPPSKRLPPPPIAAKPSKAEEQHLVERYIPKSAPKTTPAPEPVEPVPELVEPVKKEVEPVKAPVSKAEAAGLVERYVPKSHRPMSDPVRKEALELPETEEVAVQCNATMWSGRQCARSAVGDTRFCSRHQGHRLKYTSPTGIQSASRGKKKVKTVPRAVHCAGLRMDGSECMNKPFEDSKYCAAHDLYAQYMQP